MIGGSILKFLQFGSSAKPEAMYYKQRAVHSSNKLFSEKECDTYLQQHLNLLAIKPDFQVVAPLRINM